jgi:hypothetical protein
LLTLLPADDDAACAVLREHGTDGATQPFCSSSGRPPAQALARRAMARVCAQLAARCAGAGEPRAGRATLRGALHKLAPLGGGCRPVDPRLGSDPRAGVPGGHRRLGSAASLGCGRGADLALLQDGPRAAAPRGHAITGSLQPTVENAIDAIHALRLGRADRAARSRKE